MAAKLREVRLGDLSEVITKGTTPTSLGYRFTETGINFVKSECVTFDGWIDRSKFARIDAETHAALKRSQLKEGDVLFSMAGVYIGKTAVVPRSILPANTNQAVGIVRLDQTQADPRFIDYFLRNPSYNRFLNNLVSQSAQPNLNLSEIRNLPIMLPPLADQKKIASVLGALDDKIELNRRMNATLEAMARALFKSWFVDFDPVRAKLDGRKPEGMDEVTAALFPSDFENSPIGPVPKGWSVERFEKHITADRGLSYKGEGLSADQKGLPMHNLNSVYEGGGYKHEGIKYYAGEYRQKHLLEAGDMIVTNTEQGFDHLLIGHAAIVPERYGATGLFSHHLYRVRVKTGSPLSLFYLVQLFNNRRWHYWISGFSNGTTINMLPKDALEMPLLVVPSAELVTRFTAFARCVHSQIEANLEEIGKLATLRDTLLPKLLSGELRPATEEEEAA